MQKVVFLLVKLKKMVLANLKRIVSFLVKLGLVVLAYLVIFSPESLGLDPQLFGGVRPIDMWYQIRDASRHSLAMLLFWLVLASGVKLLGILSGVIRWKLLLKGQGITLPFWYMTYLWFAGRAIGMFIPGTLGLDGWRLVESSRYTKEWVKCTTVIAVEKLTGFIALTFLVFITFPFGFRLLDINPILFGAILVALFCFTAFCFLLLFNPRIIQVLVMVLPAPAKIRGIVNRVGTAATAYSAHRGTLLLAVFFGLGVHLAICLMTFCTMMAIRAPNTGILDIMFASPIMIYASVLTPTINGMGVRELIFGFFLGTQSGHDAAVTYGHLGLWTGEFIPFLISIPLLLIGGRPSRKRLQQEMAELREQSLSEQQNVSVLSPEQVRDYSGKVYGTLGAGILGGLAAGALIALIESAWLFRSLDGLKEVQMFTWGPIVYGLIFAGVGAGVAGALLFLYLLLDRFASWAFSYALAFMGAFAAGGLVIGVFRFKRDLLAGHAMTATHYLQVAGSVLGMAVAAGLLLLGLSLLATRLTKRRPVPLIAAGMGVYLALILAGALAGALWQPAKVEAAFAPENKASGPSIILVAVDTLRADYLKLYNPQASANTPAIDAFVQDAVLFQNGFAQASWTKPSFATMFSGLYPEQHRATTKTAALPDSVQTVSELLQAAGYFTKGFPNNPNVSAIFNFDQGFVEYTYLEPSLYFLAEGSSAKLALYEVLRRVRQVGGQKLAQLPGLGGLDQLEITEFYQPADVVTQHALEWVDGGGAEKSPFFLYLHYMDPHDPFLDPEAPGGGFARVRMEHPDPELHTEPMKKAYIRGIENLDRHLGPLFDGLKQRGLYDNSLIVFTSDHGEEFYDHRGWWHGQTLYDELTKIPYLLKLPANQHAGMTNQNFARHVDLAPTMLHLAGLQKPPVMPGIALWDPQGGFTNSIIPFSYSENDFEGNVLQAVRTKDSKIIQANEDNARELAPVELYDMVQDPGEQQNLAEQPESAEEKRALQEAMAGYQRVIEENAAEPTGEVDSEQVNEQMESLGYL